MKNTRLRWCCALLLITACNNAGQHTTASTETANPATNNEAMAADTSRARPLPAGPTPNTRMTPQYVRALASYAYLWGWPMVNMHNRAMAFAQAPGSIYMGGIVPFAPPGQNTMLTDYIDPAERIAACPNQDVAYGVAPLDFNKGPLVIQVPDFGDRFWVYQVCDQRTDGFASLGKMYGTKPGFYLFAATNWNEKVPNGINGVFRCNTTYGTVLPRVFLSDDPADKQAAQPAIAQIVAYPLSQFDGKMKTKDWTKTPKTPPDPNAGAGETKWVDPAVYFDELPAIMKEVPPQPGEEALYAQINALLDVIGKDAALKKAASESAVQADKDLVSPLFQFVNVGYPIGNNWTTASNGAQFGTDYLTRTACAKANIFVNKPAETKYFYQDLDATGARLQGSHQYTITFPKGGLPPVRGFWSLTLYDQHHLFAPNELNRYSLGTKNKNLQLNPDGSMTLYVQATPPEAGKQANWLPAPRAPFSLYIRSYWPDEAILKDQWIPPPVVKVK